MKKRQSRLWLLIVTLATTIVLALICAVFLKSITSPIGLGDVKNQEFVVERGQSAKTIAQNLEDDGLIRTRYGFRYALKRLGLENKLQAGVYNLNSSMDAYQVARTLTLGIFDVKLTIPEGYRVEQIALVVEKTLGINYQDFLAVAGGYEGYLFPDTYYIKEGATAEEVASMMKANFLKKFPTVDKNTVILASLVERETKGRDEKPIVAGILLKRLENNWPLELDATMQYIVGKKEDWWPSTTLADRERISPYNTYLNQGVPPTPICNPGADSVNAVLNPTSSPYWFYLHDPSGNIRYARTNAEHTENIDKYLR